MFSTWVDGFKKIFFTFSILLFASVDINNASQKELMELTGIGKAKAKKIVDYREQNQCFGLSLLPPVL
jgi:predicted DNA-binding helix-hairpin-helix protein